MNPLSGKPGSAPENVPIGKIWKDCFLYLVSASYTIERSGTKPTIAWSKLDVQIFAENSNLHNLIT